MCPYISNLKQFVSADDLSSSLADTILDRLPFNLFANDFSDLIGDNFKFIPYIDNIFLPHSCDRTDIYTFAAVINESLARIDLQMMENTLYMKTSKNNVMLFNFSRSGSPNFRIRLKENAIDLVDTMSCLGIILYRKLNFDVHLDSISAKICLTLRKSYNLNLHLPVRFKYTITHVLCPSVYLIISIDLS